MVNIEIIAGNIIEYIEFVFFSFLILITSKTKYPKLSWNAKQLTYYAEFELMFNI